MANWRATSSVATETGHPSRPSRTRVWQGGGGGGHANTHSQHLTVGRLMAMGGQPPLILANITSDIAWGLGVMAHMALTARRGRPLAIGGHWPLEAAPPNSLPRCPFCLGQYAHPSNAAKETGKPNGQWVPPSWRSPGCDTTVEHRGHPRLP